jgi:hypothetical protein
LSLAAIVRMSMFRSKKLDLSCFVNVKILRDHTKRKVFAQNETQRYDGILFGVTIFNAPPICSAGLRDSARWCVCDFRIANTDSLP